MKLSMRMGAAALVCLLASLAGTTEPAEAQSSVRPTPRVVATCGTPPYTYMVGNYEWALIDQNGNACVSGTISASLAGFTPAAGATANVTDIVNTSQDVALPVGADAVVTNKGAVDVNFRIQVGAGTAVSTDQTLKAGAATGIHLGTATHLSVIAPTGTGTGATAGQLNIQGGSGLAAGYGGGGGSSGGGGDASAANQVTGNNSLSSIDTKLTTSNTNTGNTATSASNTATNTSTTNTNLGATSSTPLATPSTAGGISGVLRGIWTTLEGTLTTTLKDSGGGDATDTTNHAIKVNVVAGGAGGGAVTVADGADGTQGAKADAAWGGSGSGSVIALLKAIYSAVTGAIPAGSATIGNVGLVAGTANIGNVGTAVTNSTGTFQPVIGCDNSIPYDASTSGSTQLVALSSGKTIYVCGYTIHSAGTVNVELDYGTGTACATGTTKMTPAYQTTAQDGAVDGGTFFRGMKSAASNAVCIKTSGAVAVQAVLYYAQF